MLNAMPLLVKLDIQGNSSITAAPLLNITPPPPLTHLQIAATSILADSAPELLKHIPTITNELFQ